MRPLAPPIQPAQGSRSGLLSARSHEAGNRSGASAISLSVTFLRERNYRHRKSAQLYTIGCKFGGRGRIEGSRLIHKVHLPASRACDGYVKRTITFIDQQHALFAVLREKCDRINRLVIGAERFDLY